MPMTLSSSVSHMFLLAAKELRHELLDSVMKCWAEYLDEKFGDVYHYLNPSSQIIWRAGVTMITSATMVVTYLMQPAVS